MVNPTTKLNSGYAMPLLGLGVYDMYNQEAVDAIRYAIETGYKLIDTANLYENESQVGQAIKESGIRREDLFITTKVGNNQQGYDSTLKAIDQSLKKLQTNYVDLYLIHWPIKSTRKDTWKAFEYIYTQGLAKSIGVSNYLSPFLKELDEYASIVPAVNQLEYSPWLNLKDLKEDCDKRGIQLQAYSPLTRGQKFNDKTIVNLSEKYEKSPAQIILRWAIQQGISTIPKSSNKARIKENFDIFNFEIEETDMNLLNNLNEDFRVVEDPMILL